MMGESSAASLRDGSVGSKKLGGPDIASGTTGDWPSGDEDLERGPSVQLKVRISAQAAAALRLAAASQVPFAVTPSALIEAYAESLAGASDAPTIRKPDLFDLQPLVSALTRAGDRMDGVRNELLRQGGNLRQAYACEEVHQSVALRAKVGVAIGYMEDAIATADGACKAHEDALAGLREDIKLARRRLAGFGK